LNRCRQMFAREPKIKLEGLQEVRAESSSISYMELRVESSARETIFQKSVQAKGIPVWNITVFQDG
jgi:hypothetical protein